MEVVNLQKFQVRVIPGGLIHALGVGDRFEVEGVIYVAWHVLTRPTSPRQSVAVWALSTATNEEIYLEPQQVATGATAALTTTYRS